MTPYDAGGTVRAPAKATTAITVALLACALWTVAVWTLVPISVQVDGRWVTVPAGATVADLIGSGLAQAPRGDVLSVGGGVAAPGQGGPPRITVNGRPAREGQPLFESDVLVSGPGLDVRERVELALVAVPIPHQRSGEGPDVAVSQLGAAGLQSVRRGALSHEVEDSYLIRPATPMIVRRQPFPPGTRLVALTFDDGPWPGQTQRILEILASGDVKATFFMLGVRVRFMPALAKRVADEGHLLGNHSLSHRMPKNATPQQVAIQMIGGHDALRQWTGVESRWFRAPGGMVTPLVRAQAAALGERIAGWTVDPADWRKPAADVVVRRVVGAVRPGAIVLLHDGGGERGSTIAALPEIITLLKAQGYRFVTLDELSP
jgi:peptidoglycan/xylan/chitin deacetylase (PgdA/CDA1 family)